LRAAVRSRTRLSSSRKVTSKTQCSEFSTLQCRRIARARVAGSSPQLISKRRHPTLTWWRSTAS
jgi:hypothetical protein